MFFHDFKDLATWLFLIISYASLAAVMVWVLVITSRLSDLAHAAHCGVGYFF